MAVGSTQFRNPMGACWSGMHQSAWTTILAEPHITNKKTPPEPQTASGAGSLAARATLWLKQWASTASFSRDASTSFAMTLFSASIGLITTLLLARLIGAENYGIYAVAIVYVNIFAYIACLGFTHVIVRRQAQSTSADDVTQIQTVHRMATITAVIVGVCLAAIGWVLRDVILPTSNAGAQAVFLIAMGTVVPVAFLRLREAILLGCHQPILSVFPERIVRPALMLIAVLVIALLAGGQMSAYHAICAQVTAYVATIASAIYLVHRCAPADKDVRAAIDLSLFKEAVPFFFVGLTTLLAGRVDVMMLAGMTDAETVGQYRLAAQIAAIVMMLTTVSQTVLSPKVSKLSHQNDLEQLIHKLPKLAVVLFVITALFSTCVYMAFQFALPWIGTDFSKSLSPLAVLLIAFTAITVLSPALPMLTMTGNARYAAYANVTSIALNVALNLVLIPQFGGTGAALSTAISIVVLYVLYTCFALRVSR